MNVSVGNPRKVQINVVGEVKDGFVRDQAEDSMVDYVERRMYNMMSTIFTTPQLDSHFEHRMVQKSERYWIHWLQ